ncbi:MAG: ComF family protein [Methyloceanibacter sp.]|nr:ComF family protein [Methyloceanibacter sp.]
MAWLRALSLSLSGSIMASMAIGGTELDLEAPPASARGAAAIMRPIVGRFADLLLPPVCISCRAPIGSHGLLCGACFARIDFIAPPICARLGVPLPYDAGEGSLSARAIASPPVYDRARAAARYSETMRELIQSFKYRDRQEGLPLFARWLKRAGAELLADADLIVPVPLYASRLWWRRFNQSAMLALSVGKLSGIAVDCFVLKRVRRTASQVGLTADQRRRNVAGAFKVEKAHRGQVRGKKIVVVDDVITTGATAESCARALKRAGAARVDVLALARAVEPAAFLL